MNIKNDKLIENNNFSLKGSENFPLKMAWKSPLKNSLCQWCDSEEIFLVSVSSLWNLKVGEVVRYQKLWQERGWPTKFYLCWFCKQNCELAHQGVNLWLCPKCHGCLVFACKNKHKKPAYEYLPTSCFKCGWKQRHLTKQQRKSIADEVIKSGLSYQRNKKTANKNYFAWCSFCEGVIEGKQKDKGVKNRNQVRFWTDKVGEERLICNGCLRRNGEFQRLLLRKYRGRWRVYKCRGLI